MSNADHSATVSRHTALGYYTADCPTCGQLGKTPTSRYIMIDKVEQHVEWWTIQQIVTALSAQFGITTKITVELSNKKARNFGKARYLAATMELNRRLAPAELLNTIRHELAHFMAWERYQCGTYECQSGRSCIQLNGHCELWKACAIECGAEPERYTHISAANAASYGIRWMYTCGHGTEPCQWPGYKIKRSWEGGTKTCAKHHLTVYREAVTEETD